MRRRIKQIGLSERLRRDRDKEQKLLEKVHTDVKPKPEADTQTTVISKHAYAKHKKARDYTLTALGLFSELHQNGLITVEEMEERARATVKYTVRSVGLKSAMRAWGEVFRVMDHPSRRKVNDVKMQLYALEDAWTELFKWKNPRVAVAMPATVAPKPKEVKDVKKETDSSKE